MDDRYGWVRRQTYVETQFAPTLKPGDIVILDNLSSHKSERAEKAIRAQGAWLLSLPDAPGRRRPG